MRPYRAIPIGKKDFVYGGLYKLGDRAFILQEYDIHQNMFYGIVLSYEKFSVMFIEVIPETVSQQVGLKDKNGKEIYEGDWVQSTRKHGEKTLNGRPPKRTSTLTHLHGKTRVIFHDGGFFLKKASKRGLKYPLNSLAVRYLQLEIIGNIHQEQA